jgi:hypothetical protein
MSVGATAPHFFSITAILIHCEGHIHMWHPIQYTQYTQYTHISVVHACCTPHEQHL